MLQEMFNSKFTTNLYTLVYLLALPKASLGQDSLHQNQTLIDGQTLKSPDQMFEFGFFSQQRTSNNRFVGIWYTNTPEIVIWVLNRYDFLAESKEFSISILRNGTLGISRSGMVIWSRDLNGVVSSNPVLQLLNSGNLVIVEKTSEFSDPKYIWQSFDYPTDTMIQGIKIADNPGTDQDKYLTSSWNSLNDPFSGEYAYKIVIHGLPQMVTFKGTLKTWRSGIWNRENFNGLPLFPIHGYRPVLVFDQDMSISISEPINNSTITRLTLDPSGVVGLFTMTEKRNGWNLLVSLPRDRCDNYALCGPNRICKIDESPMCQCLKGFSPTYQKDWDFQDISGGCSRTIPLDCKSDGFFELWGVKFPDMLGFWLNTSNSMGLDECRENCLSNCSCTAYANPFVSNGGSGCLMWFGELVDMRDLSGRGYNNQSINIRLSASELGRGSDLMKKNKKPSLNLIIPVSIISSGVLLFFLICGIIFLIRRHRRSAETKNDEFELPLFEYAKIAAATSNFSSDNIIGKGGFGPVYKGHLSSSEEIAVKRLSKSSGQGLEEFKNEVILIAKLQHRDLVRLLGCCIEGEERMLIYEYMENKSLDYFVFHDEKRALLTWPKRFDIIQGIARGLLYLHQDSRLKIVHRDLKTSNILLDGNLNPKISDFGLARILGGDQTMACTKRVVGTYGYMAPEYAIDGKFSVKSDIFSIGVVLLEIVSGKKNRGFNHSEHYHSLLGHAWLQWKEDKAMDLMDECLSDSFVESQVKRCIHVGLLCVQKLAEDRPIMSTVLSMLRNEGANLPEPKEPGFFIERSSENGEICRSVEESGLYTVTLTDLEAR